MECKSTKNPEGVGLCILTCLEDLKNRLKAEGRDEDADTVRVAILHVEDMHSPPIPTFRIAQPRTGWRKPESFTDAEAAKLRPMAETLAMLDGNAFFGTETDASGADLWYRFYLPEADAVYQSNGGDNGWAGEASFAKVEK